MRWRDYWTVGRVLMFIVTVVAIEFFPMLFTFTVLHGYTFYMGRYLDVDPDAFCFFWNPYLSNAKIQCVDYYLTQAYFYLNALWVLIAAMVFLGLVLFASFPYASEEWRTGNYE